jgi:serine/threonine protein phosphatase PrpC
MIECGWSSEHGEVPDGNEDAVLADMKLGLLAVADGIGGRPDGGAASRLAVRVLRETVGSLSAEQRLEPAALIGAVGRANAAVRSLAGEQPNGPGTTLSAVICDGSPGAFVHVGDSRIYQYRGGRLRQLTEDHTLVAELLLQQRLTPAKAAAHPLRHMLSRALGLEDEVEVDSGTIALEPGDWLILATDGLANVLSDARLQRLVQSATDAPASALASQIMSAALAERPQDNLSLVVARMVA